MFIILLTSIVNVSNLTKCVSLNNQQWIIQPNLISLQPNQYSQGLRFFPFAVNLDGLLEAVILLMTYLIEYVFQKTEDLNLSVFSMITRINESKASTKHISCKCKYKFSGRKYNLNQKWGNDKCL